MAKIGFTDLVALAKSGWTPEQVNNTLDRLEKINEESSNDDNPDIDNPDNSNDDNPDAADPEQPAASSSKETDDSSEDEKDKRIKELEAQLKAAQKDNVHQNNDSGEKKELDDLVDDIFKEFFD